ncbi:MAG: FG-GAP repeat protein [Elusimicrobia bacterium]|nr:FG-GAP repeat protein [Elusimicrobiota bacterium]
MANRFVFFALLFWPVSGMAVIYIQPNEANGTLFNDSFRNEAVASRGEALSVGDFNGDGRDDVAILMEVSSTRRSIELFFGPYEKEAGFLTIPHCTLFLEGSGRDLDLPSKKMADLNGDGRDDLAVYRNDADTPIPQIQIVFGEEKPSAIKNLDPGDSAFKILGLPGTRFGEKIAAGDFNGDTVDDYAVLYSTLPSIVYLVLGEIGLSSGTVDLSIQNPFVELEVPGWGTDLVPGHFNQDGNEDLAVGAQYPNTDTQISVYYGQSPFPAAGGSPLVRDVQILGHYFDRTGNQNDIGPVSAGDLTGDHLDELVIFNYANGDPQWVVSGSDIASGKPVLRQQTGTPESVIFYPVPSETEVSNWKTILADFDADGADDLLSSQQVGIGGILTTDIHPGGIMLNDLGSVSSLGWVGDFNVFNVGDFNGDGFRDLVAYENFNSIYPPYGALRFLFGFRPLKNPRITVPDIEGDSRRVTVSLSVDGAPTEMRLSGDITSDFKDQWIPFRSTQEVVLSPGGGTKTISARFRNSVGRESETVDTQRGVEVKETQVVTETNRLRVGGRVSFDCHRHSPGVLRGIVYGPRGEEVVELENRWVESGIYPVQWNGTNSHGNRVARGVYYLVIEMGEERIKREILVE